MTLGPLDIEPIMEAFAKRIAVNVVALLAAGQLDGYLDQSTSPLGPRRHIDAIRSGKLPGFPIGRRWLARIEDVDRYARELDARKPAKRAPRAAAPAANSGVAAELGYVAVDATIAPEDGAFPAGSAANGRSRRNGAR